MSVPFETQDAANKALQAFFDGIDELRKTHRISDVLVLVEVGQMIDGEECRGSASLQLGNVGNKLPMLAREYGAARQQHDDQLAVLSSMARRGVKGQP